MDLREVFIALGLALALLSCGCDSGRQENPARSELPSTRGRGLFESYCSACHQLDGRGREGGGPLKNCSSGRDGPGLPADSFTSQSELVADPHHLAVAEVDFDKL